MSKSKQLGEFTLAGMIIGPILGSGLVILPPLLYNETGNVCLIIWAAILTLGFMFAVVFGKLSSLYPGEGGASVATEVALGAHFRKLTSFYLICAVFFGPVAVSLIAGEFLHNLVPVLSVNASAVCILLSTFCLLLIRIQFLGKLMLAASSVIALIFVSSSVAVFTGDIKPDLVLPAISGPELGHSFLVAFWAIVGWEVIGGYSKEVKSNRCFMRGVVMGALVVSFVYALVIAAICFGPFGVDGHLFRSEQLIGILFGEYSSGIVSSVSILLCLGTLVLFLGSIARLISSMKLTKCSSTHSKSGTPIGALSLLTGSNLLILGLVCFDLFNLKNLVAIADGFFLANAIIGLITAIVLFKNGALRVTALILTVVFLAILSFSKPGVLLAIVALLIYTCIQAKKGGTKSLSE